MAKTAQSTPQNPNPNANRTIGHYLVGKFPSSLTLSPPSGRSLGQGTFGKVRLGTHLITGEKVAIKILEKDKIKDQSDVERVTREIHILKIVRHPNVIQLYEVRLIPRTNPFRADHRDFQAAVSHHGVRQWRGALRFYRQEEAPLGGRRQQILPADYFGR